MTCVMCGGRTKGADAKDSPQQDVCTDHWFMISPPLRKTLTFLWRGGRPREGYAEARAAALRQLAERA